jgi:hypothetical protein
VGRTIELPHLLTLPRQSAGAVASGREGRRSTGSGQEGRHRRWGQALLSSQSQARRTPARGFSHSGDRTSWRASFLPTGFYDNVEIGVTVTTEPITLGLHTSYKVFPRFCSSIPTIMVPVACPNCSHFAFGKIKDRFWRNKLLAAGCTQSPAAQQQRQSQPHGLPLPLVSEFHQGTGAEAHTQACVG